MSSMEPITLPVVTIDPTFTTSIQEVQSGLVPTEKIWISCYKASQPSVHGKIQAELHARNRSLVVTNTIEGDLTLSRADNGTYLVSCDSLGIQKTPVLPPIQEYYDIERSNPQKPQRITAFDVSPDSSRFATGFLDGSVFLYPITSSTSKSRSDPSQKITPSIAARAVSRPHLSTTTSLQFFPSSHVLLSAGADFCLSILPADLPEPSSNMNSSTRLTPVRTLRAHSRPVTATAMIGPGRNILSASLDGSLKLWDVPSSAVLTSISSASSQPILSVTPAAASDPQTMIEGTTVFGGLQDGSVQLFDLRTQTAVEQTPATVGRGGASALAHSASHNLLAVGSSKGHISIHDIRSTFAPVTSLRRGEVGAGIEELAFLGGDEAQLAVTTSDGLPYLAKFLSGGPEVAGELVGGDCDPVRFVRVRKVEPGVWDVWSAADDAIVRRWRL
ncbi:hypothetical protein H0H93_004455 [Arthromyces matolae]|nr:hypothetical protein H0H93_004455 [Arthromyces matolae]